MVFENRWCDTGSREDRSTATLIKIIIIGENMFKRIVLDGAVNNQYRGSLKKLYRSCCKRKPEKILDISKYQVGSSKQELDGEYLGSVQVSEGLLKQKQHIFSVYKGIDQTIKYIDYAS